MAEGRSFRNVSSHVEQSIFVRSRQTLSVEREFTARTLLE